ncbi:VP3 [Chicken proventriculitis-associated circular virus 17]|nr:VP3 [Chicken proventriculitis-associated circular virus 17]
MRRVSKRRTIVRKNPRTNNFFEPISVIHIRKTTRISKICKSAGSSCTAKLPMNGVLRKLKLQRSICARAKGKSVSGIQSKLSR